MRHLRFSGSVVTLPDICLREWVLRYRHTSVKHQSPHLKNKNTVCTPFIWHIFSLANVVSIRKLQDPTCDPPISGSSSRPCGHLQVISHNVRNVLFSIKQIVEETIIEMNPLYLKILLPSWCECATTVCGIGTYGTLRPPQNQY